MSLMNHSDSYYISVLDTIFRIQYRVADQTAKYVSYYDCLQYCTVNIEI